MYFLELKLILIQIERLVCEETIRELFSQYDCEVVDVKIKQYKIDEVIKCS